MTKKFKLSTVIGARPQFIKSSALSRVLQQESWIEEYTIHSGQHYDDNLSAIFFDELKIQTPKYFVSPLNETINNYTVEFTSNLMKNLCSIWTLEKPDAVLVYGDTNSTLAAALCAAQMNIPIAHVEAGLRSHRTDMPEELNRKITDHISHALFCPTENAVNNLSSENITKNVFNVGDLHFDASVYARNNASSNIIHSLNLRKNEYALCTVHRSENTRSKPDLMKIIDYLRNLSESFLKDKTILLVIHPRTRKAIDEFGLNDNLNSIKNITIVNPVGYFDMQALIASCYCVITDSGTLQKEAYFHSRLCLTLRDETEWVETVRCGWNRLWDMASWVEPR
ncbi:MAG: non-hydrolyzing UDP-N-acetylglucosamine 2-epimerase, partial [Asticcacaulis sp.]